VRHARGRQHTAANGSSRRTGGRSLEDSQGADR
jgi:hypothetical protein